VNEQNPKMSHKKLHKQLILKTEDAASYKDLFLKSFLDSFMAAGINYPRPPAPPA